MQMTINIDNERYLHENRPRGAQSSRRDDILITPGVSQRYLHNFCRRKLALKVFGFLGKINCMQ